MMKSERKVSRKAGRHLFAMVLFTLILSNNMIHAQAKYRPGIDGEYVASVFVVTSRVLEKDDMGNLVFTNEVDTNNSLKYLRVSYQDDQWFAVRYGSLAELLDTLAPFRDWALWVHGDGHNFLYTMRRALEIQHLHRVNFIVFSWPTQAPDKGPISNHKNSRENAIFTVPHLEEICIEIQQYRSQPDSRMEEGRVSLFFHSLANYLLQLAVEEGSLDDIAPGFFDNIILNAPAVDSEGHNLWVEKLDMQKRLFICYNDEDFNLEGLRVLSSLGVQLGERPSEPLAANAVYLDFTDAVGSDPNTGATHSYYYAKMTAQSENIRRIYTMLFHGDEIDLGDDRLFMPADDGRTYRVIF